MLTAWQALNFVGDHWSLHRDEVDYNSLNVPQTFSDSPLFTDLLACAGPDADTRIDRLMDAYSIHGDPDDCAAFLRPYGAWDEAELANHSANLRRLIWLTAYELSETDEVFFVADRGTEVE